MAQGHKAMKAQRNIIVQVCHCESCASRDVTIPMGYEKPQMNYYQTTENTEGTEIGINSLGLKFLEFIFTMRSDEKMKLLCERK